MHAQYHRVSSSGNRIDKTRSFSNSLRIFYFFLLFTEKNSSSSFYSMIKNKVYTFCFESKLPASLHWIFLCIWLFIISFSFNHLYAFGNCPGCYNLFRMANKQIELCISIFLKLNFCAVHPYSQLKRQTPLLYTYKCMSH